MIARMLAAPLAVGAVLAAGSGSAFAQEGNWFSGDWRVTLGAAVLTAPDFKGAKDYMLRVQPMVSVSRAGSEKRFSSRNDNISFGLIDNGAFRAGVNGKVVFGRDSSDYAELNGLDDVSWGAELGGFAEVYPTDWMRLRGEVRQGIGAHHGVVADLSADAFQDIVPGLRVSGGPRMTLASADYFDAWYGVSPGEAAASGLAAYSPGGGVESVGVGGAVTWQATDRIETSIFGEYSRLVGSASDSSIVRQRGSSNQFLFGISATYTFDVTF